MPSSRRQGEDPSGAPGRATDPTEGSGNESVARPSEEQIARRAHEIFERRGGQDGHDLEDWLQAEEELRREQRAARDTPSPSVAPSLERRRTRRVKVGAEDEKTV